MSEPLHTKSAHARAYRESLRALPPDHAAQFRAHAIRRTEEAIAWHEAQIRALRAKLGRL